MAPVRSLLAIISLLPAILASPVEPRAPSKCRDITFTVSATAQNRVANDPPADFTNPTAVIAFLLQPVAFQTVSGTQKMYGQYCEPTSNNPLRANTLQLLVPGNSYGHTYYSAFEETPSSLANSWAAFANAQGYPTLAIDRVGTGRSDHPDPVSKVQAPYQAELIHDLITQLRSKTKLSIPTSWKKIIWVGHSYGSILGTQMSANHPGDIDAYIQTGIAIPTPDQNALPGELADVYLQASVYDPVRFPPAIYTPGYLVATSKEGRRNTFYSRPLVDFSPALYDIDFKVKDTLSLGEALTQNFYNSTSYSNPVYILTGQQDAVFCGNGSRLLGNPDCGSGATSQLAAMKVLYPAVPEAKFDYYAQPNSGHCNQIHYTASAGFGKAHAFLAKQGL